MNDLVKRITDNWEDAIGYGLTAVQGRIDCLGAKTVPGSYCYGPAANLPSVKGASVGWVPTHHPHFNLTLRT